MRVDFIELHILHHAADVPLYGLWMIGELAEHGYRVGPSHLYRRFHRLERKELLRCSRRVVQGKSRKCYRITALGPEEIREALAMRLSRAARRRAAEKLSRGAETR